MNLFGNKKKPKQSKSGSSGGNGLSFSRVQVVSKPEIVGKLLKGVKEQTIEADVARQKLKAASLVSGRGRGTVYNYTMHPFKSGPRPVAVVSFPRSTSGGNFMPADNPMEAGEVIEFAFEMPLEEAGGSTLYFNARGPYLQTALYIPNAKDPGNPWVGSRELTEKKMGEAGLKQGEEVLQVRVDQLTVYPNAPETFTGDQFSSYIFSPSLFVICGGGVWTKRGGNGYFEEVPEDLTKHLEKQEQTKEIKPVTLTEFGVDTIAMVATQDLFTDFEHDRLVL